MSEFTDFEIQIDLSEQEAWGGESRPLLPPGDYVLVVTGFEQKPSQNSGNNYIEVEFTVDEGQENAGSKVWNNYSLSQKALGRIKSLMVACKTQLDKIVASQFVGAKLKASVFHEESQPSTDQNGNPRPQRMFARVINEQPLDDAPAQQPAKTATPPVMNKAATTKNSTGAARRA